MRDHKKSFIVFGALILVLGTLSLHAQNYSRWYGSGDGTTTPPVPTPYPVIMYPWHEWLGDINDGEFFGAWMDTLGNYGNFRGRIVAQTPTTSLCKGVWRWSGPSDEIKMGPFEIIFNYETKKCEGKWSTYHNTDHGTIWGERIE